MKKNSSSSKGFSLLETMVSVTVLILVISVFTVTSRQATSDAIHDRDMAKLNELLHQKMEKIRAVGFWVWPMDTTSPHFVGASDPSQEWATELEGLGIASANLNVVFLKRSSGTLTKFSGLFEGNDSRQLVQLELSMTSTSGKTLTQNMVLGTIPERSSLIGVYAVLKRALVIYAETHSGTYPASLSELVTAGCLDEIPNDPYTPEKIKVSHVEEEIDWYYQNNGQTVSLAAFSNPDLVWTWPCH